MAARKEQGRSRLFVAADPPPGIQAEVSEWARHLVRFTPGLRAVPARNIHITLAFIGDRDRTEISGIADAVADATDPASGLPVPTLSLGAPVWLPPRRPRALALDIHDDRGDLAALQAAVASSLDRSVGWRAGRPFRAHLTAARTGRGFETTGIRLPVSPALLFEPESVTLYESTLHPDGARYEPLERIELG
ncbi:MAG: RNA 2',3'-cyclic phosphodiesterase [Actinomycetota bacterium]|nr:RNA 2',3'-cyclic phosphodiesterase [Actinomycetota bacterium]